jgi:Protein of unknown function (DUF3455)
VTVSKKTLIACLVIGAASSAAMAPASQVEPPAVPSNLEVPEGNKAYRVWHATGTQNYICLAAGQAWTFIGPQATLFDDEADQVLTHFLSPNPIEAGVARATWQHSKDTSSVWAVAIQSSTDPGYVTPGAIPWLLLRIVGAQAGAAGGEKLVPTTFIQRVHTAGGSAPSPTCSQAGARVFVPYETDYVFYKAL